MKIVIPNESGGGSPWGLSRWLGYLECAREKRLNKLHNPSSGSAANVGVLFHKILEYYYDGTLEHAVLEFEDADNADWAEAMRMFREYRRRFPPTEMGEVVGTEIDLEVRDPMRYGVPILTGRADMVIRVTPQSAQVMQTTRNLSVKPGIYLVDTKTKKQNSRHLPLLYANSLQFAAYQMMWDDLHPDEPCQGMIANVVVRHKNFTDNSFFSILVAPPTPAEQDVVKNTLKQCNYMRTEMGDDFCNVAKCFTMYGPCKWLTSGLCDRVSTYVAAECAGCMTEGEGYTCPEHGEVS